MRFSRISSMNESSDSETIIIDGVEYNLADLSENAKAQILNLRFVEAQIQQLNNEWAVADTARIGYANALKSEISQSTESD
jgi:hypothetical protein